MTPEGLSRIAGVMAGLGLAAGDADIHRRRQLLRRILPVTGPPGGAGPGALAQALHGDVEAIAGDLPSGGTDLLDDRDRYRWEAMRRAALARRLREEGAPAAGARTGHRLAPLLIADARAIVRFEGRAFVAEAFTQILGRRADPDAMRHYSDRLNGGTPKGAILREIAASAEGRWKRVYVRRLWQTTRVFRRRVLAPAPVVWTARLLSRGRYTIG